MAGQVFALDGRLLCSVHTNSGSLNGLDVFVTNDARLEYVWAGSRRSLAPGLMTKVPWLGMPVVWCPHDVFRNDGDRCTSTDSCVETETLPISARELVLVSGHVDDRISLAAWAWNPRCDTWCDLAKMHHPHCYGAMAHGDSVFAMCVGPTVLGGMDKENTPSAGVEVYDVGNDAWRLMAPMSLPRIYLGAAVIGPCLFAVGGVIASVPSCSGERYQAGTWTPIAPMSAPRYGLALVALDHLLYAIGGSSTRSSWWQHRTVATVERYDVAQDSWTTLAPLNHARSCFGAGVYKGCIYVFGGCRAVGTLARSVERYDPDSNTWTHVANMLTGLERHAVAAVGEGFLLLGGRTDSPQGDSLHGATYFNARDCSWSPLEMPRGRHLDCRAVTVETCRAVTRS